MQWAVAFETVWAVIPFKCINFDNLGLTQLGEIYVNLLRLMIIAVAHMERRY